MATGSGHRCRVQEIFLSTPSACLVTLPSSKKGVLINITFNCLIQWFRSEKKWLFLFLAILFLVYLPTFLYPYLLADETSLVRYITLPPGRYLFAFISWGFATIFRLVGFYAIYVMRGFAVFWLALAGYFLMRWFEYWGHERTLSFLLAICIMTLPAYQIVVADGTQLAFAIFVATFATHYHFTSVDSSNWRKYTISSSLLLIAILTYQQQLLVALSMLAVPLLMTKEWRVYRSVISYGAFVTILALVYFICWKFIFYPLAFPGKIDTRYGPHAVHIPGKEQFIEFMEGRISQVANLWNVHHPYLTWIVYIVFALIIIRLFYDLIIFPKQFALKLTLLIGLIIGSDFFRFATGAYHSYVTATALTLILFYMAFSGLDVLLRKKTTIFVMALAVYGCFMAFITVKNEIAIPNRHHMDQITEAVINNPNRLNFHIDFAYKNDSTAYQEFQWRNTGVYLHFITIDVLDHLAIMGTISDDRRGKMYVSVGGAESGGLPDSTPSEPKADSFIVKLEKP